MKKLIVFIVFGALLHSCFSTELEFEDQFLPVVEAYVYSGEVIEGVRVTNMISFGDDSTGGTPLTDVMVEISHGGDLWILEMDEADTLYGLSDELDIVAGDSIFLNVTVEGNSLSSFTLMPSSPPEIEASETTISIPRVSDPRDFQNITMPDPVVYSWDNPDGRYLFFRVQNIENYEDNIMPDPPDDMPFKRPGMLFQMDTEPTNSDSYELSARELTHYGTHRIIVYSVNEEYVALYNSMNQDSRELNEPFTNIEGGLGIFTAFSSDTLWLEVEAS